MDLKKYAISYKNAVARWDEALPIGNGKIGCLIYGDGPLHLSLDRVDLWDKRPNPVTQEKAFNFKNLVKLVKSGKEEDWQEYIRVFEDIYTDTPNPTKITAGRIELDFGIKTQNISSRIDLQTAIADIEIEKGAKAQIFASATHFIGVARIDGKFDLSLRIPAYISGDDGANKDWIGGKSKPKSLDYPRAEKITDGEFTYYKQNTFTEFSYGVVALKKEYETYSELYFTIATNEDAPDYISLAKEQLLSAEKIGYEKLKKEHISWWKTYWKKSEISIGDELLEKVYYRSYYLFASCSRKGFYPMPLQGVWTADNDCLPPWKGDYHHDTNTQLSYQSFLKANRLDEGRVFIDYLWSLKGEFKKFAKNFYGVKGLLIPGVSTIDGKPMGGWAHYSLSPTMSIWTAQSFDEYWLYTGDMQFLKTRAYPFLKEVGEAIYGLLEEKEGKLYLPLSSSPEIFDNTRKAYLQPNSNFDTALLLYLYKTLQGYEKLLGRDGEKYAKILEKLDGIAIEKGKRIRLDKTQNLEETHRHFSHLMCLYPLHLINYDTEENKIIYEDTFYELERLGMGMWVGFSYAMCAQIYAMGQKGNSAYEKLRMFANGFVAENGFHLNGDFKYYGYSVFHYRPFTLESSFGYCDALQEMLLQEHQGYLHLFPAVPVDWQNRKIYFKKLRSYQGVLVSAWAKNGLTEKVVLESKKEMILRVKNTFGVSELSLSCNGETNTVEEKDGYFEIRLKKGKTSLCAKA